MKEDDAHRVQTRPKVSGGLHNEPQLSIERSKEGHFRVMAKGWLAVIAVIVLVLVVALSR